MGTDLPPAALCGRHQVLSVVEGSGWGGAPHFLPILHLLMAKLDLNSGVTNCVVLLLYWG